MLIPLTRQALEKIIPAIATGAQYVSCWGRARDVLRRLLISVVALTTFWLVGKLLGSGSVTIKLIFDITIMKFFNFSFYLLHIDTPKPI